MMKYLLGGIFILLVAGLGIRYYLGTAKLFKDEVDKALKQLKELETSDKTGKNVELAAISEEDLKGLPVLLQTYLRKAKVLGSPRVQYFHVKMTGEMKLDQDKPYAPVKAEQYTFTRSGRRLFFMTMNYNGLPISGLHHYYDSDAFMKIKILDLIKVVDNSGLGMQKAETVTYFNDLCIMAPGALLDEDITWEAIDEKSVKGTLRKHGHEISSILSFNEEGMLENFISEDRMDLSSGEEVSIPWSTPMTDFNEVGDYYLPQAGSAVWHYPDADFEYIRLNIDNVEVNKP